MKNFSFCSKKFNLIEYGKLVKTLNTLLALGALKALDKPAGLDGSSCENTKHTTAVR